MILSFKIKKIFKVNWIIRARACTRCREYVIIHAENPQNQNLIRNFEGTHRGHTVVTLDLDEVKGSYQNFVKPKVEESSEEGPESPQE